MSVHLINSFGGHAIAGGNVGTSLLSLIKVPCDTIVVELSSFQLQTIGIRPYFAAAALLNVTPNHLDYHANFAEYVQAKLQLLSCIKEKGTLFVGRHVPAQCRPFFHEQVVGRSWYDLTTVQEKVAEIFPLGYRDNSLCLFPHDVENAAAALMLARIALANSSLSPESLKEALMTFVRPPHRLERIAIKGGVTYINDSKATSVDAVIKAVEAIPPPIVLIVGGVDKGGVYREWIPHFKEKVVKVFALGEAAQRIKSELEPEMCVVNVPSLYDGVKMASEEALRHSGSTVLLSPGCSSYDQFKDYQHRGETFREFILSDAASRSVQGQSESRRVSDHEESRNVQRAR